MKRYFFCMVILFATISAFTQEIMLAEWGYGLDAGMGVMSGNELPGNYSFSFQGLHDSGLGLSLDYIKGLDRADSSGLLVRAGLLGSVFLGIPLSQFFIPYVGGGLGVKFNDLDEDTGFAWKVDGGVAAWLTDILYVKAGVMYDNIREGLGVSVGVGFKLSKTVSATYRDYNGTFERPFAKYLWEDNSTPDSVYVDELDYREIVRTYRKNTTKSSYIPAQYELESSGGTTTTTLRDQDGNTMTATTTTPIRVKKVKTADAETTTWTYVWDVTVTRNWYTRTFFYKDQAPTTERVYLDTESAVLVDKFSETKKG